MPPVHDPLAAFGIGGLVVLVAAAVAWLWIIYAPAMARLAIACLIGWMALTAGLAKSGVLSRFDIVPPPMAMLIVSVFALAITVGLSPAGGTLARAVPLATLVGLQAFRLPLELVMHHAAEQGIMPPELSYSGYNFDIATGLGALLLFLALRAGVRVPRGVLWAWNVWGLGCLVAIAGIAIATSPIVRAFGDDPRHLNTWVLYFPYVWLPSVLVVTAIAGHIVITRSLILRSTSAR